MYGILRTKLKMLIVALFGFTYLGKRGCSSVISCLSSGPILPAEMWFDRAVAALFDAVMVFFGLHKISTCNHDQATLRDLEPYNGLIMPTFGTEKKVNAQTGRFRERRRKKNKKWNSFF